MVTTFTALIICFQSFWLTKGKSYVSKSLLGFLRNPAPPVSFFSSLLLRRARQILPPFLWQYSKIGIGDSRCLFSNLGSWSLTFCSRILRSICASVKLPPKLIEWWLKGLALGVLPAVLWCGKQVFVPASYWKRIVPSTFQASLPPLCLLLLLLIVLLVLWVIYLHRHHRGTVSVAPSKDFDQKFGSFEERLGVWTHKTESGYFCPKCKAETRESPMKKTRRGWVCPVCKYWTTDKKTPSNQPRQLRHSQAGRYRYRYSKLQSVFGSMLVSSFTGEFVEAFLRPRFFAQAKSLNRGEEKWDIFNHGLSSFSPQFKMNSFSSVTFTQCVFPNFRSLRDRTRLSPTPVRLIASSTRMQGASSSSLISWIVAGAFGLTSVFLIPPFLGRPRFLVIVFIHTFLRVFRRSDSDYFHLFSSRGNW